MGDVTSPQGVGPLRVLSTAPAQFYCGPLAGCGPALLVLIYGGTTYRGTVCWPARAATSRRILPRPATRGPVGVSSPVPDWSRCPAAGFAAHMGSFRRAFTADHVRQLDASGLFREAARHRSRLSWIASLASTFTELCHPSQPAALSCRKTALLAYASPAGSVPALMSRSMGGSSHDLGNGLAEVLRHLIYGDREAPALSRVHLAQ
jgi:hypothetical protein